MPAPAHRPVPAATPPPVTATARGRPAARAPEPPALTPGRRRLFAAITLALPLLLVALLELGLRAAGYGDAYPLFIPYADRPEYLFANPEFSRRYFGAGPFTPTPRHDFFRAEKPPGTFRIFFQGGSSAAGFPYGPGGAPSRMLEQRLQATFPGRDIEVVNTALTAISSYTLLDQADEIIAQRPDAVLIYAGHNEYYGALGAASARSVGRSPRVVRAYLALRGLRTVQLAERVLAAGAGALAARDAGRAPRTVMELMAGDQRVPLGSPRYAAGLAQFRANLGDLLARYRAAGVPVLVGTVASNERDQPPLQRGGAADSLFALGRALDARGDTARARAAYRAAKERDELRFRAPEAVNAIIRAEAARHGAAVVETQQALARAAPGGVVGRTLMLEHVHPNLDGYFLIADAFYEAMRRRGMIGSWAGAVPAARARREIPVTAVDSLTGVYRADRLTSDWPFRPRGAAVVPVVDTLTPRTVVERIAQAVVRDSVPWPEAMERLRAEYERAGALDDAVGVARAMAQEYRYSPQPYMDAARLAVVQRRHDEALRYVHAANARRATANSVQLEGLLRLRAGDGAGALEYLRRARAMAPGDERARVALTAAEALPELERARAQTPRDTSLLYTLASAYALTQQFEKARAALAALRAVDPAHAGARGLLQRLPP